MYNQTVIGKRRKPSLYSPKKMQIPCMGLEQNKYPEETEEKQPRDQQHQQVLHCGAIYERPRRNLQKHLQKIWGGSLLQGGSAIRDLLVHLKDKDNMLKKSGVIYKYSCGMGRLWRRIHW